MISLLSYISMTTRYGYLSCYLGCMYSSKTSHLIQEISRYAEITNQRPLVINHLWDTRDPEHQISCHDTLFRGLPPSVTVKSAQTLGEVDVTDHFVIGIDEAQFFPDLYVQVLEWVQQGKHLIVAGLNGTYKRELFGDLYRLL